MPGTTFKLELRAATLDDAGIVADLDTLRDPDEPADPVMVRHWWAMNDLSDKTMRLVAVNNGEAMAYVSARHEPWETSKMRYGNIRIGLRPDVFTNARFDELVTVVEKWLRSEGAGTSIARVREDFKKEVSGLERLGYREIRRTRSSELDLVEQRARIQTTVEACREEMRAQGVRLLRLSDDTDPQKVTKLYHMTVEAEKDIPTTAPWRVLPIEEWTQFWFENPGIREDRFWIAREGESIVGMSVLDFPVTRGVPYTAFTATARAVRGRGIARALKYETMNQAIELGCTRVRTNNDADNAPILRINKEMGYRLVMPILELHRDLTA
jgi:GNAT superfamily N-acetyltransferase